MKEYIVGDAANLPDLIPRPAAVAQVDFAWARPQRNGVYVTYPTHAFEELKLHIDAVYDSLMVGGWAFFDADDWLLPRLISYLQDEWGDVASTYRGGGYRRVGSVVYEGNPGGGHYFTNGGYHVVFAHKGETDRQSSVSSKLTASRPPREMRDEINWGTLKPIEPYKRWIDSVIKSPDELVAIPHAGTAPGAIALEQLYGDGANYVAVDSEPGARESFQHRRELQAPEGRQDTIV